jgi:hypothetical protein
LRRYEHLLVVTGSCVLEQLVALCLVLWAVCYEPLREG